MLKYIYQTLRFFRNAFSRNISPIFSVFVENVSNGTALVAKRIIPNGPSR